MWVESGAGEAIKSDSSEALMFVALALDCSVLCVQFGLWCVGMVVCCVWFV